MAKVRLRFARLAVAALAAWLAATGAAHAEVAAADPNDVAMRQCLARRDRSSTDGQIQCMDDARQKWQAAMNAAYQQLLGAAPAAAKRGWQESQRRWLAWRGDEMPLVQAVYATTQGTMYAMASADTQLQPVRDRALALREAADRYAQPGGGKDAVHRVRPCLQDAACEHALFDLNRYFTKLQKRMPARSRAALTHAQREWTAFRDATTPLISEDERVDLIGARVATLKRFSETVGNR
ncbi:lysozyme inhibitor LprI family protein [Burkholderia alba]|uniref:lysozyme inhibitor LprI family protein n=1 Tax=Burkholderia alba TaxID=2683677 RepID=UPI002B05F9B7|nr:lysozyme inhibitor LprI family protein [Burkholderia alba]